MQLLQPGHFPAVTTLKNRNAANSSRSNHFFKTKQPLLYLTIFCMYLFNCFQNKFSERANVLLLSDVHVAFGSLVFYKKKMFFIDHVPIIHQKKQNHQEEQFAPAAMSSGLKCSIQVLIDDIYPMVVAAVQKSTKDAVLCVAPLNFSFKFLMSLSFSSSLSLFLFFLFAAGWYFKMSAINPSFD